MQLRSVFPQFPTKRRMILDQLQNSDLDWQILVRATQGLVKRHETDIFIESNPRDQHWWRFFLKHYRIPAELTISGNSSLTDCASQLKNYHVTDLQLIQNTDLASSLAGLESWLPEPPKSEAFLKQLGNELPRFEYNSAIANRNQSVRESFN